MKEAINFFKTKKIREILANFTPPKRIIPFPDFIFMARSKKPAQNNKKHILARYGLITFLVFGLCTVIVAKMVQTSVIDAKKWNQRAERELNKTEIIEPKRGSILASNGNILACNLTVYDIRFDLRHPKLAKLDSEQWVAIDQLADSLNVLYPRNKHLDNPDSLAIYSWRTLFHEQLMLPTEKRRSVVTIASRRPMEEFEHLRTLPFLADIKAKGRGCPLYYEEQEKRIYPFGDVARLSLGRVYEDKNTGKICGYAGLEMALDSLLYGKPGVARRVPMNAGMDKWVEVPAVNGYDVRTTIDIDIQDMVEEELLSLCSGQGFKADWGTAVLMETTTGEIKAISNIEWDDEKGIWTEAMNRAVQPVEPGSVVKPISLMIAFEDGLVKKVSDQVETTPFQRTTDPHAPNVKDMKGVIGWSSNTGIARIIFRGYSEDPSKYYDRIKSIGLMEPMHSGIGGEMTGRVKRITPTDGYGHNITKTAQQLDLARQAYGYNIEIPPLYTLAYMNGMINGGKMVRPHLVRSLVLPDGRDSIVNAGYFRENLCSPHTSEMMRECLLEPVWGKGTANVLRDDRVKIAGKTGTAIPYDYKVLHGYNNNKRRFSFCGYFPADNPRYSCIVVIEAPAHSTSAARGPGMALKNIALKLYAKGKLSNSSGPTASTGSAKSTPVLHGSNSGHAANIVSDFGINNAKQIKVAKEKPAMGVVPDLKGLDVNSALNLLEKAGYYSSIKGHGFVVGQSVAPGTKLAKGSKVTLTLAL